MRSRLPQLLALLAALQIVGGHWMALQVVAWATMVVEYSEQEGSVLAGLEDTFSGAKPCRLCKVSQAGQADEQHHGLVKNLLKLEAVLPVQPAVPARQGARLVVCWPQELGTWQVYPPLVRPPLA